MTWFSDKMFISTRCIHGFMSNLIKKSWTDSSSYIQRRPQNWKHLPILFDSTYYLKVESKDKKTTKICYNEAAHLAHPKNTHILKYAWKLTAFTKTSPTSNNAHFAWNHIKFSISCKFNRIFYWQTNSESFNQLVFTSFHFIKGDQKPND